MTDSRYKLMTEAEEEFADVTKTPAYAIPEAELLKEASRDLAAAWTDESTPAVRRLAHNIEKELAVAAKLLTKADHVGALEVIEWCYWATMRLYDEDDRTSESALAEVACDKLGILETRLKAIAKEASTPTKDDARAALNALSEKAAATATALAAETTARDILKTVGGTDTLASLAPELYGAVIDAANQAAAQH